MSGDPDFVYVAVWQGFVVFPEVTSADLDIDDTIVTSGSEQDATFDVTLNAGAEIPNGENVAVSVGDTSCLAPMYTAGPYSLGSCSISAYALPAGTYTATASYAGDGDFLPTSTEAADSFIVDANITAVTFNGTPANPTATIWGSGFGTQSNLGPTSAPTCGGTGYDYAGTFDFNVDDYDVGSNGDCLGIVVLSYSDDQITFGPGSAYPTTEDIASGMPYSLTVLGTTVNGTVALSTPKTPTAPYAYVANTASNTVTPVSLASEVAGKPIAAGAGPTGIAITPDGSTAYVTDRSGDEVTPIATATNTPGTPIPVGSGPGPIAITPDGSTAYVANSDDGTVTPIDLATATAGTPIPVGDDPSGIAVTPDGSTVLVSNLGDGTVTPIDTSSDTAGTPIVVGDSPEGIAVSPDGTTAYVANLDGSIDTITLADDSVGNPIEVDSTGGAIAVNSSGTTAYVTSSSAPTVTPVTLATDTVGSPISVGSISLGLAVTPGGGTVYATDATTGGVSPIDVASGTALPPVTVGSGPEGVAVMPDRGPTALLSASTSTSTGITSFDATKSAPGTSPIVSYAWDFGDGNTATTNTGTITHTYAWDGTFTATVTETDAAGASTTVVSTGQTVSLDGTAAAVGSATVVISTVSCGAYSSCSTQVTTPATPTTPQQTVSVTGQTADSDGSITISSAPGQLTCKAKGFTSPNPVTEYTASVDSASSVQVEDTVEGVTSTTGVEICFEAGSAPPAYLKKCTKHSTSACLASLTVVGGNLDVAINVPPGDPKLRIQGIGNATEDPTAIGAKGTVGKTIKIKGVNLLGSTGQPPQVAFTSPDGSTDLTGIVVASKSSATALVVTVPNGAATGPVTVAWPDVTFVSQGSIAITG